MAVGCGLNTKWSPVKIKEEGVLLVPDPDPPLLNKTRSPAGTEPRLISHEPFIMGTFGNVQQLETKHSL